jgi:hypothetical protein
MSAARQRARQAGSSAGRRCCDTCGAPGPTRREMRTGGFNLAVHDCDADTWNLIRLTLPKQARP